MNELEIVTRHTDWILLVFFGCGVLLIASKIYSPDKFEALAYLPFSVKRREVEEEFNPSGGRKLFDISLAIFSYLMISLVLYLVLHERDVGRVSFYDKLGYFRILFVLVMFFLARNLIGLTIGWIFSRTEDIAASQNTQLVHRVWFSLWTFPVALLLVYNETWSSLWRYVMLVIIGVGVLEMLFFSIIRIWRTPMHSYYKIFYLCALEITPLVFLAYWLKGL